MPNRQNRHAQRKAATHQRLIDAARAVIVEHGYNNVDILDITEYADVSKATFYTHFPNKEACVREMMEQGFDALVDELLHVDHALGPDWVLDTLERVFLWAHENRELLLIMVGGAASSQLNVFGREYMVQVVERTLVAKPPVFELESPYSPTLQAQVVTGLMIQLLGWWLEHDTGYTPQMMASLVLNVMRFGLSQPRPDAIAPTLHDSASEHTE